MAWCKPTCGHHATTTHWRCACCLTLSSCPFSLPFCPFLFLFLFLLLLLWMKSAKLGAMPSTHHQVLCALCLVWWWVCGCGVWWCWLARHACMGGTSGCGWCVWPLVPPTTLVVPVVPVSVVLVSMSPPLFPLTHTQAWHTTTPHTHTHGWWLVHFGPWCVCVCGHGVGCRRAWLATHTTTHSFCPTPLHQSSCCCWWWWWWMWWWQRGCCGVCGHLVHSLAVLVLSTPPSTHTHTRGGGHVVVVAVCVVWLPPPLCAIPTNHHHCVRCPALSAVCACACVRVSGGTTHSGALWWHARWCVAERAPCPPHPPPTLSTLVRSLSSRSPSLTSHTHTQMARLTPHTHMAWFVWLHPCTTASEHTPWCTALALTTTCVLLVCVVVCTSTHSFFFHSHTEGEMVCGVVLLKSQP